MALMRLPGMLSVREVLRARLPMSGKRQQELPA
jgi:hypothetical protein